MSLCNLAILVMHGFLKSAIYSNNGCQSGRETIKTENKALIPGAPDVVC